MELSTEVEAVGDVRADPAGVEAAAVAAEAAGYDAIELPETRHDVFVSAALAARASTRVTVQTDIAVAFARKPMSVAVLDRYGDLLDRVALNPPEPVAPALLDEASRLLQVTLHHSPLSQRW